MKKRKTIHTTQIDHFSVVQLATKILTFNSSLQLPIFDLKTNLINFFWIILMWIPIWVFERIVIFLWKSFILISLSNLDKNFYSICLAMEKQKVNIICSKASKRAFVGVAQKKNSQEKISISWLSSIVMENEMNLVVLLHRREASRVRCHLEFKYQL